MKTKPTKSSRKLSIADINLVLDAIASVEGWSGDHKSICKALDGEWKVDKNSLVTASTHLLNNVRQRETFVRESTAAFPRKVTSSNG